MDLANVGTWSGYAAYFSRYWELHPPANLGRKQSPVWSVQKGCFWGFACANLSNWASRGFLQSIINKKINKWKKPQWRTPQRHRCFMIKSCRSCSWRTSGQNPPEGVFWTCAHAGKFSPLLSQIWLKQKSNFFQVLILPLKSRSKAVKKKALRIYFSVGEHWLIDHTQIQSREE